MRPTRPLRLSGLLLSLLVLAAPDSAFAAGISAEFDSCGIDTSGNVILIENVNFNPYQVPAVRSAFANRDLELLWSNNYSTLFGRPLDAPRVGSSDTDLDLLGVTLCNTPGLGTYGFPVPYVRLIYDYLRAPGLGRPASVDNYNTNPEEVLGFAVGQPLYGDLDRNHIDTYLFAPKFSGDPLYQGGGEYGGDGNNPPPTTASVFADADEDVSSGHPALLDSILHGNSINIPGPRPSQVGIGGPNDWTGPRALAPLVFNHEFQHSINTPAEFRPRTEIFSHVAEALTGELPETPVFDVPYTWGLFRSGLNYAAYRSFSAYLTYIFRGPDTTFAGRTDDLVWRWARSSDRSVVSGLGQQLVDSACAECASKTYFAGLSAVDRANLVVHNWRVANYVNQPSLAEGQYGFPSQFGFEPNLDVGNWQNIDTSPGATDSVNIEIEVELDDSHITRERSFAGTPTGVLNPANAHALALAHFGSEYWVVRSNPSLWDANRDLVVRIMPEGFASMRLMASAVAYGEQALAGGQPDSLWNHPEWAQLVVGPGWIDLATGVDPDPLELVVPNFGMTHKAALIVITAGSTQGDTPSDSYALPFRMNLTLRTPPFQSPNPVQVTTFLPPYAAALPAWSPDGVEMVFTRSDATAGPDQIYRAPAAGGTATALWPQPFGQYYPAWSPRGDWVAFDQDAGGGSCDIWALNPTTGASRRLTSAAQHDFAAAFSPNGQQVVYLRAVPFSGYQLRRVNLDGSNDQLLLARQDAVLHPPRWAPNGSRVYLAVGGLPTSDSLYAVEAAGPDSGLVIQIAQLGGGEVAFDPPRGAGRWVWESAWKPPVDGNPSPASFQRLALRGAPAGPSETIFSRPGSHMKGPRWSGDGTRVTFSSSDPNPFTPSNILVGQISYNHAPSFAGLGDQALTQGVAFQLALAATDPDGETLTYEAPAVFLPPGASFDPGTRTFLWPDPQPAGAEYYVVFRALDPSGGVSHRVVKYTVQSPGGGCPFVDTRTTAGWREENSVLARSLTGTFILDAYRLKFTPDAGDGRLRLRLRENEQEYTTLDEVRLVAVDHAPDVRAYAVGERFFLATRVPAHRVTTASGRDITAFVSGEGGYHWGSPGDTLFVEMTAPAPRGTFAATGTQDGGGGEGGMEGDPKEMEVVYGDFRARGASPLNASAVDVAVLGSTGIRVEVSDGGGGWRTLTHYYPRRYRDEVVLDSLGSGPCRLIFVGRHRLHFIGRYLRATSEAAPQTLTLLQARHSRLGDAAGALGRAGGATRLLAPGDTLELEFEAIPLPAGQVRDYFLLATGVYSSTAPLAGQAGEEREPAPLPTRFALAQNRPNPFARTTSIPFALPVESPVRLEVFDPQGRSVAVLAEGVFPAGFHAVEWDRRDGRGALARPGVYLYRLTAGAFRETRKLLLAR
jgi:Tol biopolymer transport system component